MHKLEEILELIENVKGHIYETIPNAYNGKRWRVYKEKNGLYKLAPYIEGEKWEDIKWLCFHKDKVIEGINELNLNLSAFHNILFNHLLTYHYVIERELTEIEKVISAEAIQNFQDGMKKFEDEFINLVTKTLKKSKFKIVEGE